MIAFIQAMILVSFIFGGQVTISQSNQCRPANDYNFSTKSGYFRCKSVSPKQCMDMCSHVGCNEWSFYNVVNPFETIEYQYHICRCLKYLDTCYYGLMNLKMRKEKLVA